MSVHCQEVRGKPQGGGCGLVASQEEINRKPCNLLTCQFLPGRIITIILVHGCIYHQLKQVFYLFQDSHISTLRHDPSLYNIRHF